MPIRLRAASLNNPADTSNDSPEFVEVPFENRVTEKDGQALHWAHNQMRSMPDDGVAIGHTAFVAGVTIVEDNRAGEARS